jgi:hypothetical protein
VISPSARKDATWSSSRSVGAVPQGAHRADGDPLVGGERHPGVRPDVRRTEDQRVAGEPHVRERVGHQHRVVRRLHRDGAEGRGAVRAGDREPDGAGEELARALDEADRGHGGPADPGRELGHRPHHGGLPGVQQAGLGQHRISQHRVGQGGVGW